jgi:alkaline phosphatase D
MSVFETERLTFPDDVYAIHSIPLGRDAASLRSRRISTVLIASLGIVSLVSFVLAIFAVVKTGQVGREAAAPAAVAGNVTTGPTDSANFSNRFVPIRKVAFGSCSAYDLRPQPVWKEVSGVRCSPGQHQGALSGGHQAKPVVSCYLPCPAR